MQCPKCGNRQNFILIQEMKSKVEQKEQNQFEVIKAISQVATMKCNKCNIVLEKREEPIPAKVQQRFKELNRKRLDRRKNRYQVSLKANIDVNGKSIELELRTFIKTTEACGLCEAKRKGKRILMKAIYNLKSLVTIIKGITVKEIK